MKLNQTEQLTIVGGGITGLVLAYLAARTGRSVRIIEAQPSFGGLLNSFEIGGNRLEHYYHHFFTHDAELMWLIKELNLEKELQFFPTTMGVYRKGKIYDFNSPLDLLRFKPMGILGKIRFGLTSIFLGKIALWERFEDVSALKWFQKWAGKSASQSLWEPLLNIKFGPFADQVPLAWMIGRLRQRMNSRKQGEEKLGYLKGSLQVLLEAMLKRLEALGVELIPNAPVEKLIIEQNKLVGIETPKGNFKRGKFIFTIPTHYLAPLLQSGAPELSESLAQIEYFGAVCVILEMNRQLSPVYWLNIAEKGFPFGGIIEHTNFIPPDQYSGNHIAYLSRYFAHSEPIAKMNQSEIVELMIPKLKKIYPDFDKHQIDHIHVFKTQTAATVCDLHFSRKVPDCQTPIEQLYLVNMSHVYPDERSVNNSIRIAAEACKTLGLDASDVPEKNSLSGKIGFTSS